MTNASRALIVGLALAVGASLSVGCAGPYAGKAEKLKKPPKKKMPDEAAAAPPEVKWVPECQAKFQEDAGKAMAQHYKGAKRAGELQREGVNLLEKAGTASEDGQVVGLTKEGIGKLRSALLEDPYHAEATYYLAVGYAKARRKACALALLKRLTELAKYDDFTSAARRMIKQGEDDSAFSLFRKEANEAMGL
ncbi:MAG TPA: hypothetical protein VM734_12055 [Kofleriaceae bacterium]|nr:hypothetical protein [Kofleriaceae bacterium]